MIAAKPAGLSRREREIMDVLYQLGGASVEDVRGRLTDPAGYDSVRNLLRILERKGHASRRTEGIRHIFFPLQERKVAAKSALQNLVQTFFGGSYEQAAAALISVSDIGRDREKLDALLEEIRARAGAGTERSE